MFPGCFNRRGQLVVDLDNSDFDEDTLMLMAIEAGADDVVREKIIWSLFILNQPLWKRSEKTWKQKGLSLFLPILP